MTEPQQDRLRRRIADRSATVGVVGLGYVGLPTAVAFADAGFAVTGIDLDPARCSGVASGRSHVEDVPSTAVARHVGAGRLRAVTSCDEAGDLDVIDICVPTPLDASGDPDLAAIMTAVEGVRGGLRPGQLVILTSTTYPGTTTEVLQPALTDGGLTVGRDVFLAFAPERIDPGNATHTIANTPRIVGGATPACTRITAELFRTIADTVIEVSSPEAAEMTKLLENTFRSVNIALANEVAIMCRHLGVDVWEVIDGAATKPYGFMPFYPGPGLGGHCIPVDPSYLSWKLRRLNYTARFINLATEVNSHMPEYVVNRATDILNGCSRSVRGSRVLVLGVAYKADIGDLRQSPGLDILALLRQRGAIIEYADPYVPTVTLRDGTRCDAVTLDPERLASAHLVIIATAHAAVDWEMVRANAPAVLDTRGRSRDAGGGGLWHTL